MFRQLHSNALISMILVTAISFLPGCGSIDKSKDREVNPEDIFFDYKISAGEGDDNLTVMLQYRDGGEDGDAFTVQEPAKVELDGEIIPADSSKMTGSYYEVQKPIAAFTGKHSIVFTNADKKEYKEEFNFRPVELLTVIPETISRDTLFIEFDGLEPEDYVRVLLTDTSFFNDGINRLDTVRNCRLIISKESLENLANGPIQIEFIREYEKLVKNGTRKGGKLSITYSLKREFTLQNTPSP